MIITVNEITDNALSAWHLSRPNDKSSDAHAVYNLDLPVSEFVVFNISVSSSVYTRELFCSLRDHVVWAQTSRVQDVTKFETPDCIKRDFSEVRFQMQEQLADGVAQDTYRHLLPMVSTTAYSMSISLRHLNNVALNLVDLAHKAEDNEMSVMFMNDANEIFKVIKNYDVSSHTMKPILNEEPIKFESGTIGSSTTITMAVPLSLRAQLARHRQLLITDDLHGMMVHEMASSLDLSTEMTIQITGSNSFIKSMLSKRSCWIAQYDLWKTVIDECDELDVPLPCVNSLCPFKKDVMLRISGDDPNPPCPKFMADSEMKASRKVVGQMKRQYMRDGRPAFWVNLIKEVS